MKRKNTKSIIAACVVASLSFTACDGYLDTLPSDSLVSDGAITTEEDVETALNGAYAGLIKIYDATADASYYYYGNDFIVRAEVGGDDVQTTNIGLRTEDYYRYAYRQNNAPEDLWYPPYTVINRVNVLLQAIDKGEVPSTDKTKNAHGEALAIRALAHFDLLITYGSPYQKDNGASLGVPIVKEVLEASALPSRETVAAGYEAVLTDLNDALGLISEDERYGHFNRWAVKALLARVNLYKGDYDKAYTYASDVIENSPYELVSNSNYISSWGKEETPESIFDLALTAVLYGGERELWGYVLNPEGYGAAVATTEFINLLNENPEDVRLGLLQNDAGGLKRFINKYPGRDGKVVVNNIRVLRLSDIYLIAAEAALKQTTPDQTNADKYLNAIIRRAIGNPDATGVTATPELVIKERRKELVLEGHRLYDILRLNLTVTRKDGTHFLNNTDLITINWNDYRTIMPIPQAEKDANHGIVQNPEY